MREWESPRILCLLETFATLTMSRRDAQPLPPCSRPRGTMFMLSFRDDRLQVNVHVVQPRGVGGDAGTITSKSFGSAQVSLRVLNLLGWLESMLKEYGDQGWT